jgi:hypothetical protein
MEKRIVVPRVEVRPIVPPPLSVGARVRPQWLHWQVGRYREKLSFGPGGEGKAKIWVPELEGEQHNMILNQLYDALIPQYGLVGPSQYAAVGTGAGAPDPDQTQLVNEIGSPVSPKRTNGRPPDDYSEIEALATPGEYNIKRVYEFSEDLVGGQNLTEWGFSPVPSYSGPLMTRELFRDGSGNPLVLTLAPDQRLRLIYKYKVSVSPASLQNVSVNIGGDGPGLRTAKFMLTGMFSTQEYYGYRIVNYYGIPLSSVDGTFAIRRGDLLVVDRLLMGHNNGNVGLSSNAAPLTYLHGVEIFMTNPDNKRLSYEPPVGRSRRASIEISAAEHAITIKSVVLNGNIAYEYYNRTCPTGNLVFDDGQELVKDGSHKLFIGYWQVTWGP